MRLNPWIAEKTQLVDYFQTESSKKWKTKFNMRFACLVIRYIHHARYFYFSSTILLRSSTTPLRHLKTVDRRREVDSRSSRKWSQNRVWETGFKWHLMDGVGFKGWWWRDEKEGLCWVTWQKKERQNKTRLFGCFSKILAQISSYSLRAKYQLSSYWSRQNEFYFFSCAGHQWKDD